MLHTEECFIDFYQIDDEENTEKTVEDVTVDRSLNPECLYFRKRRWDIVMGAFEKLTPRQKNVVASHLGFCENCYGIKEKLTFKDIATNNGLSSAEAAENIYKKAVGILREKVI